EAFDIQGDYTWRTARAGELHFYVLATWQPHYESQLLPGASIIDSAGFAQGSLKWRGNMGLDWQLGSLSLGWNAQYYDRYFIYPPGTAPAAVPTLPVVINQGAAAIPSQMYHDLNATYRFESAEIGLLDNAELSFGIQNVLDKSPPILALTSALNGA